MTTKTDPFTTTENPLGAVTGWWTTVSAAGLKDLNPGAVSSSGSVQDNCSMWATSNYTFLSDHTSTATIGATGNFDWAGVGVRLSTAASGHGYVLYYEPETPGLVLYPLTAGTRGTGLASYGLTVSSGDTIGLGCVGTTLTAYHNGTSVGSITDSTYSSGQPGVAYSKGNANVSIITSWTGADAAGGASTYFLGNDNYF